MKKKPPKYRRVLLKLSGEILMGEQPFGISSRVMNFLSMELEKTRDLGVELAIVVGGGNFFRGASESAGGIGRAAADNMGMLATAMNALALQGYLNQRGISTRVQSAIPLQGIAETFDRLQAIQHLEKGQMVVFAGGTGHPFFTTDTAASLRALEIEAQVILKGTRVDGVYDTDPEKSPNARKFSTLSGREALERRLRFMDATAISLCMEHGLPIVVFNVKRKGSLRRVVIGESVGTIVEG
ncbi:MAG: UMP kinase [Deltaproteobacteria bacterium]|nr:UMP kinase [Deltaproteobacteria bacterium]